MGNGQGYCGSRNNDPNKYKSLELDDGLSNFNECEPDRDVLTIFEINSLNSTQLFEKKFPFYRMDVNGFTYLIRTAT